MEACEMHSSAKANLKTRENKWEVWLEAYESATTIDDRISLIHTCPTHEKGLLFLLKEAEGFGEIRCTSFLSEEDRGVGKWRIYSLHGIYRHIGEARREIAQTAFSRLVKYLFKNTKKDNELLPSWMRPILEKGMLDAVLHFFRLDENHSFVNWPSQYGYPQEEYLTRVLREFLFALARCGWTVSSYTREVPEAEEVFTNRKKEFIRILCGLGKLDELLHLRNIGEEELKAVTELALGREITLPHEDSSRSNRDTLPQSIEEAAYAGTQAGKVAILLREKLKLDKHFSELREAHRKKVEAEQMLRQLSGARQQ